MRLRLLAFDEQARVMKSRAPVLLTVAIVNHGRKGWRWTLLDWGIAVDFGYEPQKAKSREAAGKIYRRLKNENKKSKKL